MICANPDRVVHRGSKLIYCGGALADLYSALGGDVIMAGKPYPAIYDLCLAEAERLLGRAGGRVLCIGDGMPTDVKGAQTRGLDCLFVTGGIYMAQTLDFEHPVRIGDTVKVRVEVIALEDNGRKATLSTVCTVGDQVVASGQAVVRPPRRRKARGV